jgi:hypothetical protein
MKVSPADAGMTVHSRLTGIMVMGDGGRVCVMCVCVCVCARARVWWRHRSRGPQVGRAAPTTSADARRSSKGGRTLTPAVAELPQGGVQNVKHHLGRAPTPPPKHNHRRAGESVPTTTTAAASQAGS